MKVRREAVEVEGVANGQGRRSAALAILVTHWYLPCSSRGGRANGGSCANKQQCRQCANGGQRGGGSSRFCPDPIIFKKGVFRGPRFGYR